MAKSTQAEQGTKTLEQEAAEMALAQEMARMDPLAALVNNLVSDVSSLGAIFEEKAKRNGGEPDMADLKTLIDAEAAAVNTAIAYREEQRKEMIWAQQNAPKKEKNGIGFTAEVRSVKKPTGLSR